MTPEQLKASILQYAMEGKLVKQDPNDEPASVLLEKIKAEKAELVKEGKIKKSKKLPEISDDEKPFKIPDSWEWVRFGSEINILRGGSPRPIKNYLTDKPNGINWIKIGDSTKNSKYIEHAAEKIIPEGLSKTRKVSIGDFLLSNSMSFGRPYILKIDGAVHDGWLILTNYNSIFNKDYLYYLLSSPFVHKQFVESATGSTVKNLNRNRVANTIALIPPLEEQKRIVAKIEQLMPLVDEYAKSYNRLQKIDSEFDDKLKQSILQYAMEGKLVKQDPNDEPASVLLEKIKAEKAELVKEKKIKKTKPLPPITDAEKPFDIPDSWEWVRLGDVAKKITDGTHNPSPNSHEGKQVISAINIKKGKIDFSLSDRFVTEEQFLNEDTRTHIRKGDILLTIVGSLGNAAIVDTDKLFTAQRSVAIINSDLNSKFLYYVLISKMFRNQIIASAKGTTQKGIYLKKLANLIIPVPSLLEQNRIVEKISKIITTIY